MRRHPLPLNQLVHENLSIVMDFAYSRGPIATLLEHFHGEWKYLHKALLDISERRATKACLELGLFLRLLEDDDRQSGHPTPTSPFPFGRLVMRDGTTEELTRREVSNKLIHAASIEWDYSKTDHPVVVCTSDECERWVRAEIELEMLAAWCGQIMS
jgi:hypothetical protein